MKQNKLFLILATLLVVLVLSACAPLPPTTQEPQTNFPTGEEEKTTIIEDIIPVEVNYEEVRETVRYEGTNFLATPADELGDQSTYNRIAGSNAFEVAVNVILTYVAPDRFEGAKVPLTIIDERTDKEVYKGTLLEGTNEYKMILTADHAGYAPRFKVCFGGTVVCEQLRTEAVNNQLKVNLEAFSFNIERGVTEKQLFLTNDGNTYITAFFYFPSGSDYELSTDVETVTLSPGQEQIITLSTTGTKDLGKVTGSIYALPDSCAPSGNCASTAKIKNEITIQY